MSGRKSKILLMAADPGPEESHRTIEDILGSCLVRGANIAALLHTLACAEAFQGTPADCLEGLEELMARLNADIAEAHATCEGRVRTSE